MSKLNGISIQSLNSIFNSLARTTSSVFWVRSSDFERQLYLSHSYEKVCLKSCESLYEHPETFHDNLVVDDKHKAIEIHEQRKDLVYSESVLYFRFCRPDGTILYFQDICFPVFDGNNQALAIAGFSECLVAEEWSKRIKESQALNFSTRLINDDFSDVLSRELSLKKAAAISTDPLKDFSLKHGTLNVENTLVAISKREAECLFYLLQGLSAKETGSMLNLSQRTVESHLESIKRKTKSRTKLELISKFSWLL